VTKLIEETKAPKSSKSSIGEDRILDWLVNEKVLSIALEGWHVIVVLYIMEFVSYFVYDVFVYDAVL